MLLGQAQQKEFWSETVRNNPEYAKYREELHEYWDKHDLDNKRFAAMTYSEFKLFWTTGDRDIYQGQYFSRRTALEVALPLALIYPEEPKYLEKIMDWVYIVCDEYTWCLPAHQKVLEVNCNDKIDLFAAECSFNLAVIYTLLEDRLDQLIKERIMYETYRRVFKPFTSAEHYGWWEGGRMNWTSVCVGSIACGMMLLRPDLVTDALIDRFNRSMATYMTGFAEDGVCLEGCGYWSYGFGYFTMYADMVRRFTDGRVDLFHSDPKVKAVATFPQKMFLSGSAGVSFADSGRGLSYSTAFMHRLKTEYPDDVLVYSPIYSRYSEGCGRLPVRMYAADWLVADYYNHPDENASFEHFFAQSQWYVNRTESYGFAAKAGNNGEFHNHNDVGSFIFAKEGKQLICDLGSGSYTRQYFDNATRYTILECSSLGHGVPIVNGLAQGAGDKYSAKDVTLEDGVLSMEIAGAYPCAELTSLKRSFKATADGVTMRDEIAGDVKVTERLVTVIEPTVEDGRVIIDCGTVSFDPAVCTVKVTHTAGTNKGNRNVYLIDFELNEGVKSFEIKMA